MSELSPAAEAVLDAAVDAYGINYSEFHCCADRVAAAALRAAANEIDDLFCESGLDDRDGLEFAIGQLFLIAHELESQ